MTELGSFLHARTCDCLSVYECWTTLSQPLAADAARCHGCVGCLRACYPAREVFLIPFPCTLMDGRSRYPEMDRHDMWLMHDHAKSFLKSLPNDSILLLKVLPAHVLYCVAKGTRVIFTCTQSSSCRCVRIIAKMFWRVLSSALCILLTHSQSPSQ